MKAMGLDLVSVANNHSTDFGPDGLRQSMRLLDAAGIAHAGGGRDLKEARAPGIFASPHGKIALVSAASTFNEYARANDAFGGLHARAGFHPRRLRQVNIASQAHFDALRAPPPDPASQGEPAP